MAPEVQFCGILLGGTTHVSSPSSLPLSSILTERVPLGGDATAHTAPWLLSNNLHANFSVYNKQIHNHHQTIIGQDLIILLVDPSIEHTRV